MGDDDERRPSEPHGLQADLSLQTRQTMALEKIAEALGDVRGQLTAACEALNRIANRIGRNGE